MLLFSTYLLPSAATLLRGTHDLLSECFAFLLYPFFFAGTATRPIICLVFFMGFGYILLPSLCTTDVLFPEPEVNLVRRRHLH